MTLDIGGTSADVALIEDGAAAIRPRRDDRRLAALHPDRRGAPRSAMAAAPSPGSTARRPEGRPGKRRLDARPGLLRPWRHAAHHHRRLHGARLYGWTSSPMARCASIWRWRAPAIETVARPRPHARSRRWTPSSGSPSPACSSRSSSSSRLRHRPARLRPAGLWRRRADAGRLPGPRARHAPRLVPPRPGVLSALGGLIADIRNDFIRTLFPDPDEGPRITIPRRDVVARSGPPSPGYARSSAHRPARLHPSSADMRYRGQSFEIETSLPTAARSRPAATWRRSQDASTSGTGRSTTTPTPTRADPDHQPPPRHRRPRARSRPSRSGPSYAPPQRRRRRAGARRLPRRRRARRAGLRPRLAPPAPPAPSSRRPRSSSRATARPASPPASAAKVDAYSLTSSSPTSPPDGPPQNADRRRHPADPRRPSAARRRRAWRRPSSARPTRPSSRRPRTSRPRS